MSEIDRRNIQKCVHQFIFIDLGRRDLAVNDLTKNTIVHDSILLEKFDYRLAIAEYCQLIAFFQ